MPANRCVVFGCSNFSDTAKGISIHFSPQNTADSEKWKKFVRTKRANFNPIGRFVVCSAHFEPSCFSRAMHMAGMPRRLIPRSIPSIWSNTNRENQPQSKRSRRHILKDILNSSADMRQEPPESSANEASQSTPDIQATVLETSCIAAANADVVDTKDSREEERVPTDCDNCALYEHQVMQKHLELKLLQAKMKKLETTEKNLTAALEKLSSQKRETISTGCQTEDQIEESHEDQEPEIPENIMETGDNYDDDTENIMETEDNYDDDPDWMEFKEEADRVILDAEEMPLEQELDVPPEDAEEEYAQLGEDNVDANAEKTNPRLTTEGKDCREEPKCIVFLSRLLLLFQFCHLCKEPNHSIDTKQSGTMISITTKCKKCLSINTWDSQPMLLGKFPAMNLLLSFGILTAGASVKKVLLVLKHINVLIYHETTYYYHQRNLLIPSVVSFWRQYQQRLLDRLNGVEVNLAGDARHDSMGHSAKYGTYTIFCCTIGLIINIAQVQVNEAGSSSQMEYLGHQRSLMFLLTTGMIIKQFISDRHTGITRWMKEDCPKLCQNHGKPPIAHYFDLWHIAKKIQKIILKLAKLKSCEVIGRWRKACVRHFYWAVMSTPAHLGAVKLAKFHAFLSHIINKHNNLPSKIFNKCAHGVITVPKVWLTKASEAYEKLQEKLTNDRLGTAIKNASPIAQTSALEGFHSVVNQFAPKMLAFSYLGMLTRTMLAALHFNYNLDRQSQLDEQGNAKLRVVYAKYKYGEGTVREVKVHQNYDYVKDIFQTLVDTPRADLKNLRVELEASVPEPMHNVLEKESKEDAISKHLDRNEKETEICPPTCTDELKALTQEREETTTETTESGRRVPHCKSCKQRMKGHDKDECARLQLLRSSSQGNC